jgi:hypothetical protein
MTEPEDSDKNDGIIGYWKVGKGTAKTEAGQLISPVKIGQHPLFFQIVFDGRLKR